MAFQKLVPKVRLDIAGAVILHGRAKFPWNRKLFKHLLLNLSHAISQEAETISSPKVEKRYFPDSGLNL